MRGQGPPTALPETEDVVKLRADQAGPKEVLIRLSEIDPTAVDTCADRAIVVPIGSLADAAGSRAVGRAQVAAMVRDRERHCHLAGKGQDDDEGRELKQSFHRVSLNGS